MIKVDRAAVREPSILERMPGSRAQREFDRALIYYADIGSRQRGPFQFTLYKDRSVREALAKLFSNKCAYCETPLTSGPGDIDQFRPKGGVLGANGDLLGLHYWWLANEWSNLYLACAACNRLSHSQNDKRSGKGGRFPLENETFRARVLASVDELGVEHPLLLDPCLDDVEQLLVYATDGSVAGLNNRAQATIELLGLNRLLLIEQRRMIAERVIHFASLLDETRMPSTAIAEMRLVLGTMMRNSAPYAGIARQFIRSKVSLNKLKGVLFWAMEDLDQTSLRTPSVIRSAKRAQTEYQRNQEDYSLELQDAQAIQSYTQARDRRIEQVTIKNLRAISNITINISFGEGGESPWLMLLGENASGKSTVLQALALALIGDDYFEQVVSSAEVDIGRLVRSGAPYGEISVRISGATEPRVLRIYSNGATETSGRSAQLMLLAYGSTRLLPRSENPGHFGRSYARIENLFNPFVPLVDAARWLLDANAEAFDYAARAIKLALNIPLEREFIRKDGAVGLVENGKLITLDQLSDGCQTTIALVADIFQMSLPAWKTPELAQGLVLIDEVGNHLHPSWKMRFVSRMREVMPSMQFIATTHEPLCLRGLRNGEIAVLRRGPRGGVYLIRELPSIEGMRIEQILTSTYFGLQSTLDPQLQHMFDRYNELLRKPILTADQEMEKTELRARIDELQKLGATERERRLLDAIDKFLADDTFVSDQAASEREVKLDEALSKIWREAASSIR